MNYQINRKRTSEDCEFIYREQKLISSPRLSNSSTTSENSSKESPQFSSRRSRMEKPSKLEIFGRVESQDFTGLSESQLNDCWQEMARQIKSFKRKLRKVTEWCETEENKVKDTKT